jgi:hypothetical protein
MALAGIFSPFSPKLCMAISGSMVTLDSSNLLASKLNIEIKNLTDFDEIKQLVKNSTFNSDNYNKKEVIRLDGQPKSNF